MGNYYKDPERTVAFIWTSTTKGNQTSGMKGLRFWPLLLRCGFGLPANTLSRLSATSLIRFPLIETLVCASGPSQQTGDLDWWFGG